MNFRSRALAYAGAGAAGILAAGAFAAPALAADEADVSVKAGSSKVSVGADGKIFRLDLNNAGPAEADDVVLKVNVAGLDTTKVTLDPGQADLCDVTGTTVVCGIGALPSGGSLQVPLLIDVIAGATAGEAGSFELAVTSATADSKVDNNAVTVPVEVVESGYDLGTAVSDVYAFDDAGQRPVLPGETAPLFWAVINQGDKAVQGLRLAITLPEHVSFVEDYEGCTISADRRVISCEDADVLLAPGDVFVPNDDVTPVEVSEDAPGPVTLTGGSIKASGISVVDETPELLSKAAASVPDGFAVKEAEELPGEVDPGDNDAEFAVFVGAQEDNGGGGGGGGDGELPLTGVQAGLIGGVGLAALAGGGVLFMITRRRRLVLVSPDDEVPTA